MSVGEKFSKRKTRSRGEGEESTDFPTVGKVVRRDDIYLGSIGPYSSVKGFRTKIRYHFPLPDELVNSEPFV